MRTNIKKLPLFVCIAVPLTVGGLSALLTRSGMKSFEYTLKPPLTPPGWVFAIVWTVLYILMGIASYIVYTSNGSARERRAALGVYALQLGFNFLWSVIFFNMRLYLAALVWLVVLFVLVLVTMRRFGALNATAAYLIVPYAAWSAFALYLNAGVYLLNG